MISYVGIMKITWESARKGFSATSTIKALGRHWRRHYATSTWQMMGNSDRGRGREDRHHQSRQKGEYLGVPKIASDYFFIGRRRPNNPQERAADEEEGCERRREGFEP